MMALGIGLAVNNGRAAIEGLFGGNVEFVRTPKRGAFGDSTSRTAGYRGAWSWHNTIELAVGLYCTLTLVTAVATQSWASVPFVSLFSVGFLYVGVRSLVEALRPSLAQSGAPGAHDPSTHSSPNAQSILS